ncbi:MAG: hypothetical protein SFU98_10960 [Leptospiraceae bacterium]|nr:hypothetical protein [Leptospiraceae bacterium]
MNCLKAKKSAFDFSNGNPFLFAFAFISNTNQNNNSSNSSEIFSIGGSIIGFTSGSLVLMNNQRTELTLSPTDKFTFSNIPKSENYSISVKSHPNGLSCSISNATGTVTNNITNVQITCSSFTAKSLYNLGNETQSFWMDYVKFDGTSPVNATGTACTGAETGFYNACIHAAEFKKFDIPNLRTCDGITTSDSLSVFQWRCIVSGNGSVYVVSTGLKDEKGLSDLIDFDTINWKDISVTVSINGTTLLTSNPAKWWNNPIVKDNSGINLTASRTIYITDASASSQEYRFTASKVALLAKKGFLKASSTGVGITLSFNSATSFNWVEGNFQNTSTSTGTALSISSLENKFHMFRNMSLLVSGGNSSFVLNNNQCIGCFFSNISVTHLVSNSIHVNMNNTYNILRNFQSYNSAGSLLSVANKDILVLDSIFINGEAFGIDSSVNTYTNNLLMNNTVLNTENHAINFVGASHTFMNTLSANTNSTGRTIKFSTTSPKFINTIAAHSASSSNIEDSNSTSNSSFRGILKTSSASCASTGSSGISNSCAKINASEFSPPAVTNITLASSFVGAASSDTVNSATLVASTNSSALTPSQWFGFQNRFRAWGRSGTFPGTGITTRCTGGSTNCSIWDLSLRASDSVARNVNHCPSATIADTHTWSAANNTSCLEIKGAVWGTSCTTTFLRNAVEIFGDGVGNENGICESGEECIYTPNIGAYQGHGNLIPANTTTSTTNSCSDIDSSGTITNVKLWKYETNGY